MRAPVRPFGRFVPIDLARMDAHGLFPAAISELDLEPITPQNHRDAVIRVDMPGERV